jgi:hypothetical protein
MLSLVVVELIVVWLVCSFGVSGQLQSIGFAMSSSVVGIGCGCFVLNDGIKVTYIRAFEPNYSDSRTPEEMERIQHSLE